MNNGTVSDISHIQIAQFVLVFHCFYSMHTGNFKQVEQIY